MKSASLANVTLIVLALASVSSSQSLPPSIRGYKVHHEKVQVRTAREKKTGSKNPTVKVGPPRIVEVGLDGVTLEATAEISSPGQDGQVDFLRFRDIVANGIPLTIDDYEHPFALKKDVGVALPIPVRGKVSPTNAAKVAYQEATASREEWKVSGTVFVFGRFKRMGFTFKRVIPVPIALTIPNPLKNLTSVGTR